MTCWDSFMRELRPAVTAIPPSAVGCRTQTLCQLSTEAARRVAPPLRLANRAGKRDADGADRFPDPKDIAE
jgi:hypothetical protein